MILEASVVEADIDTAALLAAVRDDRAGAVVGFTGVVRDHDHGVAVTGIEYVAHPAAEQVLRGVVAGFEGRDGVHAIAVQHRLGRLGVGEIALYAVVSATHRKQALGCVDELIDEIKTQVPIWKKQLLADGTHEWSQCP